MKLFRVIFLSVFCVYQAACTKDQGVNPSLAFTDLALLDSAKADHHNYYKNDPSKIYSGATGSNGPHGSFKLRFNHIARKALTDSGQLPLNMLMPEGALIIKDVYTGGTLTLHAMMYKRAGAWLWAEIEPDKKIHYSVKQDPGTCTGCHSQAGNRDFLRTFSYY